MKAIHAFVLVMLATGFSTAALAQSQPAAKTLTADDVIARHIAARGGADNFRKLKSLIITGTMGLNGQPPEPIQVQARVPSSFRVDFTISGQSITQAYDGSVGWQSVAVALGGTGAPSALSGDELTNLQDQAENAVYGPLFDYAARGNRVELLPDEAVGGKPRYKLRVTLRTGHLMYIFIDQTTYLEVQEVLPRTANGQEFTIEEAVGNDRKFGGVLFACSYVSSTGARQNLQISNIEVNPEISNDVFRMPAPPPAPASAAPPATKP